MFPVSSVPLSKLMYGNISYRHSEQQACNILWRTVFWMRKNLSTNNKIISVICRDVDSIRELKFCVGLQSIFHFSVGEFTFDEDKRLLKTWLWISFSFLYKKKFSFTKFELLNSGCGLCASAAYLWVFTVILLLSFKIRNTNFNDVAL